MVTEITALASFRNVTYDLYANFPTSPAVEDLAYATDRKTLYRWSGAAWQYLTQYHGYGAAAAKPTAADLPDGSTYFETDTGKTQQVQAGSWVEINAPAIALTVAQTQVFTGSSPTAWADLNLSGTIGAKPSLVLLKIYSANTRDVAVRKKGDTDNFFLSAVDAAYGVALGEADSSFHLALLVATDNAGVIEWKTSAATAMTVDVIAYIN